MPEQSVPILNGRLSAGGMVKKRYSTSAVRESSAKK